MAKKLESNAQLEGEIFEINNLFVLMGKKVERENKKDASRPYKWSVWIKLFWKTTLLGSGIIIGLAGGVYWQREVCLNAVFQNETEVLTNEEIDRILQTLNSVDANSNTSQSVAQGELNEELNEENISGSSGDQLVNKANSPNDNENQVEKKFVGSRNSQKFYSVDCRFAKKIKEENKIWFSSREEGEKAGRIYLECN